MNGTQAGITTPDNALKRMLEEVSKRGRAEAKRYGTARGQTTEIFDILTTELIGRYNRRLDQQYRQYGHLDFGNWFGLQIISRRTLDKRTSTCKVTYRMDDNLCEILAVPAASIFHVIQVNGEVVTIHIGNFNCFSVAELAEMKRGLKKSICGFVLSS
jgi:hypothetical protein